MARQENLSGGIAGINRAFVYYRPAKSQHQTIEPMRQKIESSAELEEVEELLSNIKHDRLRYPIPLADSRMDELPRSHVSDIIDNPEENLYITQLLSLFCSSLRGKQLMQNKFAMLVHFGNTFLLAHVKAEPGMSLKEEEEDEDQIELIKRFLDIDNILSAAYFERNDGELYFSHFTKTGSDSFRDFLGVRKRQFHYEKKNIQIVCYYLGNKTLEVKFEFTNDEFDNVWIQEQSVSLSGDKFTPVEEHQPHQIKEIRWGNENYGTSVERFKSDFKEYSFGLSREQKRYERLHNYPADDSDITVFVEGMDAFDYKDRIKFVKDNGDARIIEKGEMPDDLHVLYASRHIGLDSGFADRIFQDIVNNLETRIYHASEDAAADEFQVGNITFLNIDQKNLSSEIREFVESTYEHAVNRAGENITKCLIISMLHVLEREADDAFQNGLNQLININSGRPSEKDVISTKENEGGSLIEYKNRQILESDDPAGEIIDIIQTENREQIDRKIFMFGFTEQNRQIEGFDTQSWNDDRVSSIEKHVQDRLSDEDTPYNDFLLQPIELGAEGDKWIITGLLY